MFQGQHFNTFVGSNRNWERQGTFDRAAHWQASNSTPLPPPTPAGELYARWEAARAAGTPAPPRTACPGSARRVDSRLATAESRAMAASSRGPHSARVASRLESARGELVRLEELQEARETIRQLRSELGMPVVDEGAPSGSEAARPAVGFAQPPPGRSPAKRRAFPPMDIFPDGQGGPDVIWYRNSEYKSDSQRGPRVGGRRAELGVSWRG